MSILKSSKFSDSMNVHGHTSAVNLNEGIVDGKPVDEVMTESTPLVGLAAKPSEYEGRESSPPEGSNQVVTEIDIAGREAPKIPRAEQSVTESTNDNLVLEGDNDKGVDSDGKGVGSDGKGVGSDGKGFEPFNMACQSTDEDKYQANVDSEYTKSINSLGVNLNFDDLDEQEFEDYRNIYSSLHHKETLGPTFTFIPTFQAILLGNLLAKTHFYSVPIESITSESSGSLLTDPKNESYYRKAKLYVSGIILRHLMSFACNSIYVEFHCFNKREVVQSSHIALNAFPIISKFNHSCCNNTVRLFYGNTLVLKATSFIPKGKEITDIYGYLYTLKPRASRQAVLRDWYHFECKCSACVDDLHQWHCTCERCEEALKIQTVLTSREKVKLDFFCMVLKCLRIGCNGVMNPVDEKCISCGHEFDLAFIKNISVLDIIKKRPLRLSTIRNTVIMSLERRLKNFHTSQRAIIDKGPITASITKSMEDLAFMLSYYSVISNRDLQLVLKYLTLLYLRQGSYIRSG